MDVGDSTKRKIKRLKQAFDNARFGGNECKHNDYRVLFVAFAIRCHLTSSREAFNHKRNSIGSTFQFGPTCIHSTKVTLVEQSLAISFHPFRKVLRSPRAMQTLEEHVDLSSRGRKCHVESSLQIDDSWDAE
jgi:hypothetical protein